jgi:hypothetical protein
MIIQPYTIVQGNYNVQLDFAVVDGQGDVVDLTGASLTFKAQDANDPTQTDLALSGSMVIDDAPAGTCHYLVAEGDFPDPGTFRAQIDIVPSAGGLISVPDITVVVRPGLPQKNN